MSEIKPVALVTGASGFIGHHVARALTREGWSLRRVVRRPEGADDEVVIRSIGPETVWQAALDGVDSVVHLAARVHHKHEEHAVQLYRDVNITGTLNLARSAATAGVRHFIFISTVLVHGRSNDGRAPFSEDDVLTPRGLYGMSKAEAEAGLRTLARDGDMKISVIRPPLIYGAGAKGNFPLLARAVSLGLPLPFAAIRNRRNFLSVQNLSSFILQRLSHPDPASNFEIFLLADRERVSTPEFIERLARASGKSPRLFGLPPNLLGTALRVMGRQDMHDGLIGSLELDISKAIATGWQPPVSLDEGLRLALAAQDA
ncbi:NAD-dependent epimerase/dehydratase family protein [Bradyrhizobium sp. CAR08]